jgi:hypothetical protein
MNGVKNQHKRIVPKTNNSAARFPDFVILAF